MTLSVSDVWAALRDAQREIKELKAEQREMREALEGMIAEWDKMTRYGSPLAKAANENLTRARAILA
jgi:hypothetical protein